MTTAVLTFKFYEDEADLIDSLTFEFQISRKRAMTYILQMAFDESIVIQSIDGTELTFRDLTRLVVRLMVWREQNLKAGIVKKFNNINDLRAHAEAFKVK